MSVLNFAASAVASLAWPAVVVIAMLLFRSPLTALVGRIRRVAVSGGTAVIDFRAALATIEARLQQPGSGPVAGARIAAMRDLSPAARIDAAWTRLQEAQGRGTSPVPADVVASLHALRNQAVAGRMAGLTEADALRFEAVVAGALATPRVG